MPLIFPSLTWSASFSIQPALLSWRQLRDHDGSALVASLARLNSSMWATPRMGILPRP